MNEWNLRRSTLLNDRQRRDILFEWYGEAVYVKKYLGRSWHRFDCFSQFYFSHFIGNLKDLVVSLLCSGILFLMYEVLVTGRQACMTLFRSAVSFICSDNSRFRNKSVEWHNFPGSLGVCVVPQLNCKRLYGKHKVLSFFLDPLIKTGWLTCIFYDGNHRYRNNGELSSTVIRLEGFRIHRIELSRSRWALDMYFTKKVHNLTAGADRG